MLDGVKVPQEEQAISSPHSFEIRVANADRVARACDYEFEALVTVTEKQEKAALSDAWTGVAATSAPQFVVLSYSDILAGRFAGIPFERPEEERLFIKEVGGAIGYAYRNPGTYTNSLQP